MEWGDYAANMCIPGLRRGQGVAICGRYRWSNDGKGPQIWQSWVWEGREGPGAGALLEQSAGMSEDTTPNLSMNAKV